MINSHHHTTLVHEGRYAAEVEVDLNDTDTGWSRYLSLLDAQKLDEVRKASLGELTPSAEQRSLSLVRGPAATHAPTDLDEMVLAPFSG